MDIIIGGMIGVALIFPLIWLGIRRGKKENAITSRIEFAYKFWGINIILIILMNIAINLNLEINYTVIIVALVFVLLIFIITTSFLERRLRAIGLPHTYCYWSMVPPVSIGVCIYASLYTPSNTRSHKYALAAAIIIPFLWTFVEVTDGVEEQRQQEILINKYREEFRKNQEQSSTPDPLPAPQNADSPHLDK